LISQIHHSNHLINLFINTKSNTMNRQFLLVYILLTLAISCPVFFTPLTGQTLSLAEYYFDTDPGFGNGTSVPLSGTDMIANFDADMSSLSAGVHVFYVRTQDSDGRWSETAYKILNKSLLQDPLPDLARAEYFFDTDPGFGNGTAVPLSGNNSTPTFNADMSALSPGVHTFYIRTQDSGGRWSETAYKILNKPLLQGTLPDLVKAEYFFDTDPGFGNGTAVPLSGNNSTPTFNADMSALSPGLHTFYIRTQDSDGRWSETAYKILNKSLLQDPLPDLVKAEYFFDTDPGFGNGTAVPLSGNNATPTFNADMSALSPGVHTFYIRTQDSGGRWSETAYKILYKPLLQGLLPDLVKAEYFFDTDPGFGNGTAVPLSGTNITTNFDADISTLSIGVHVFYIRTQDGDGRWSETAYQILNKPLLQGPLPDLVKAEYYFDTDPGFGNGIPLPLSGNNIVANFNADMSTLFPGVHQLYIRTLDSDGRWSETAYQSFTKEMTIVRMEYYFDTDPGYGNAPGTNYSGTDVRIETTLSIDMSGLTPGFHYLYLRSKDYAGAWSETAFRSIYIPEPVTSTAPEIIYTEYYLNTDPGYGNGTSVPLTGLPALSFTVCLDNATIGSNRLFVRSRDAGGRWSETAVSAAFNFSGPNCPAPTLPVTVSTTTNSALISWKKTKCTENYQIQYKMQGSSVWQTASTVDTFYTLTGLALCTDYDWQVSANCSPLVSTWTGTVTFTTSGSLYYQDADGDGYGNPAESALLCPPITGYVTNNTDCDDEAASIFPGTTEICNNGLDDNCDGILNEGFPVTTYYLDNDHDGKGNPAVFIVSCFQPAGYVTNNTDCDDNSATACPKPSGMTTTNITDNSATVSWNNLACATKYRLEYRRKTPPISAWTVVYPTSPTFDITGLSGPNIQYQWRVATICSPNGTAAESGYASLQSFYTKYKVYTDADWDGFGEFGAAPSYVSSMPQSGYSYNTNDCDDAASTIYPGAPELCNGIDDDCDLNVDEGADWYQDADSDGLGNSAVSLNACLQPEGYVSNSADCNDNSSAALCGQATGVVAGNISFSSATITWTGVPCASGYTLMYRTYYPLGAFSTQFNTSGNTVTFTGLLPNTTYQYRIRSKCLSPNPVSVSTWTYYLFTTLPLPMGLSENDIQAGAGTDDTGMNFDIYPNPGDGFFNLRLASETAGDVQITVSDGLGKLVYSSVWSVYEGQNIDQFDLSFLTGGVYQVMIQQGDLVRTRKVVVVK
jgi:phosphotransferase system IIA component